MFADNGDMTVFRLHSIGSMGHFSIGHHLATLRRAMLHVDADDNAASLSNNETEVSTARIPPAPSRDLHGCRSSPQRVHPVLDNPNCFGTTHVSSRIWRLFSSNTSHVRGSRLTISVESAPLCDRPQSDSSSKLAQLCVETRHRQRTAFSSRSETDPRCLTK